jgi:tRNA (mo5U34)-methyltransferase
MPEAMSIYKSVADIKWYHRIDLGNGVITPGVDKTEKRLRSLHLPPDLTGKTFLDVGAWDGGFSFEAERRGAKRVLATDQFVWNANSWASKDGFDFAKRALNSKVEDLNIDPLELSPETVGMWDIVLFAGVLYHSKHPLLSLEKVASVTRELLILETETDMEWHGRPAMAFYPNDELSGDPYNWCGPNLRCIKGMLGLCGFSNVTLMNRASSLRKLYHVFRHRSISALQRNRVVVHARRA